MAPKTLDATQTPAAGTTPAPGSAADLDPGSRAAAQFEAGEAEALAADEEGRTIDLPPARDRKAPTEKPEVEVRADGESADDAGEEPDGESPESEGEKPEGEESDEGDAEEREAKEQYDLALKMAGGDRRQALRILQTAMGEATPPTTEAVKAPAFDAKAEAKQFYEDVAKVGEQEAFALHLERLAKAQTAQTEVVKQDVQRQREIDAAAAAEVKALDKAFPAWRTDKGFLGWYDTPKYRNLPGVDAYTLYQAKRTGRNGSANGAAEAAAKVAAEKKARMTGAAGGIPGGRPAGPNARPHISTIEAEMREVERQEGFRRRPLP